MIAGSVEYADRAFWNHLAPGLAIGHRPWRCSCWATACATCLTRKPGGPYEAWRRKTSILSDR